MEFKIGDLVDTGTGERGRIIHVSRLTYFVAIPQPGNEDRIIGLLESQLAKVETSDGKAGE